jgi:hypothetical protein
MIPRELPGITITYRQAGRRINNSFTFAPTHACTLCGIGVQVWDSTKFWKKHANCIPLTNQSWIGSEMSEGYGIVKIMKGNN